MCLETFGKWWWIRSGPNMLTVWFYHFRAWGAWSWPRSHNSSGGQSLLLFQIMQLPLLEIDQNNQESNSWRVRKGELTLFFFTSEGYCHCLHLSVSLSFSLALSPTITPTKYFSNLFKTWLEYSLNKKNHHSYHLIMGIVAHWICIYRKVSNIRRTKSQNLNASRLIL